MNGLRPHFGAKTAGGLSYKDFDMRDGYVYRQWRDGSITIMRSPRGGAGTLLTKAVYPDAWRAVTAQINSVKAGRISKTAADAARVALVVLQATRPRKAAEVDVEPEPMPEPMPAPMPSWLVPAGLAVAAAATLVMVTGGRR